MSTQLPQSVNMLYTCKRNCDDIGLLLLVYSIMCYKYVDVTYCDNIHVQRIFFVFCSRRPT